MTYQDKDVFPPSTPRRPTSAPVMRLPSLSPHSLLPLSSPSARSTSRRLSYTLKNRAARYSLPITVLGAILTCFFLISHFSATPPPPSLSFQFDAASVLDARSLPQATREGVSVQEREDRNGVSFLVQDEEELIAEDDLFFDQYVEKAPVSEEERVAAAEAEAHRLDVMEHDRVASLRTLVWWLAEGGMFPNGWKAPAAATLKKGGARGMEKLLDGVEPGLDDEPIFADGWSDFAKNRYRVVVFSKTYCPYSKKAKQILEEYRISPAPFIIELDHRSDGPAIQALLDHWTGRRTVPNVLLDFSSIGGSDELTLFHAEGGLAKRLADMDLTAARRRYRRPPGLDKKVQAEKMADLKEEEGVVPVATVPVTAETEPTEALITRTDSTEVSDSKTVSPPTGAETSTEAETSSAVEEAVTAQTETSMGGALQTDSKTATEAEVEDVIDDSVTEDYQTHLLDTLTLLVENTPEVTESAGQAILGA